MSVETIGLWTNKGGVGKTTLTFHLSTAYAYLHPDKRVVVVDMCPQANLSNTMLTSTEEDGSEWEAVEARCLEARSRSRLGWGGGGVLGGAAAQPFAPAHTRCIMLMACSHALAAREPGSTTVEILKEADEILQASRTVAGYLHTMLNPDPGVFRKSSGRHAHLLLRICSQPTVWLFCGYSVQA